MPSPSSTRTRSSRSACDATCRPRSPPSPATSSTSPSATSPTSTRHCPDGLSSRLVVVTEAAALVYELGQLARADTITPDDLRGHGLAVPVQASRREFANFVTEYAEALDVPLSTKQRNTDLDGLIDRISADPDTVTLVPAGWPLPQNRGLRLVPIRPAPLFPWHAVWRAATAHPLVPSLIRVMHDGGDTADLADTEHWLPAAARQLADVPLG